MYVWPWLRWPPTLCWSPLKTILLRQQRCPRRILWSVQGNFFGLLLRGLRDVLQGQHLSRCLGRPLRFEPSLRRTMNGTRFDL